MSEPASSGPKRVRLLRRNRYKTPEGAVRVTRAGKWGNPFRIEHKAGDTWWWVMVDRENGIPFATPSAAQRSSVTMFRESLTCEIIEKAKDELVGRDLACYCSLESICHADVLLEVANGMGTGAAS